MDPSLAHANLAPPRHTVFARGLVPALLAHALLGLALAQGVAWKRAPDPQRIVAVPGLTVSEPADPARTMGGSAAPAPPAAEPSIQPGLAAARSTASPREAAAPAARPPAPAGVSALPPSSRVAMGAPAAVPPAGVRPSFDCGKARSPAERAICADPELAQLDRDLGRLHARAKAAAPDPAAFRRQNDAEWKRREASCRGDGDCLRAWYAERREQLLAVLGQASAQR